MAEKRIDVLIQNAVVVDGTGNPWRHGDVLLGGDRVVDVLPPGSVSPGRAGETFDADGLVCCPGFIDIQSHSIAPLMVDGRCLSKITQGVTTEIMGEASTPAPAIGRTTPLQGSLLQDLAPDWLGRARTWTRFGDWLQAMADAGVSPNVGSFLGGGTLRSIARGMDRGPSTPEQLTSMRGALSNAMREGAFGVAYALIYPPDTYVETKELIEVCRVVAEHGGVYITHIRSEGDHLDEAIEEMLRIAREASVATEIYHLKASGRRNWPKMAGVIRRIEEARGVGLDVTADMYPYTGAGTGLTSVLPTWVAEGGDLYPKLRDRAIRTRVHDEALHPDGTWEAMADLATPEGVVPIGFERDEHRPLNGHSLAEIAAERGQDWADAAIDLLVAEEQRVTTVYHVMSDDNLRHQLGLPWIKISTDAGGMDPAWAAPRGPVHPRAYGTYPRVLGHYVREEAVLGLEDAVRKMASSVAHRLGLTDRGLLQAGCLADVVIFDPAVIGDRATFDDPHHLSVGVREVWVNGTRVVRGGEHTGAKPGRVVVGPGTR
ncbi:MAG: N-acyl-D-amino-acid deacylase family protein [Candidatus Dormibacteraceae bacterium]